jgi:hypothetical protein
MAAETAVALMKRYKLETALTLQILTHLEAK